jgi:hypothetical protein
VFHKFRSANLETFNELFKGIFDVHGSVPTKGLRATRRFALGARFVYQLALLAHSEAGLDLRLGLKAFLKGTWLTPESRLVMARIGSDNDHAVRRARWRRVLLVPTTAGVAKR